MKEFGLKSGGVNNLERGSKWSDRNGAVRSERDSDTFFEATYTYQCTKSLLI